MCIDPIQMTQKETGEVVTFACRTCDQCVATRRHAWVARAMMEKATSAHCVVVTLTYNNETAENRRAAQFFNYKTVRAFIHRLNAAVKLKGSGRGVRFIACGEQGDRFGRCHWHVVLYSEIDLTKVGHFHKRMRGADKPVWVTKRSDIVTGKKDVRRLSWSLWPHGFIAMQEPDQGGMNYALSYALKDQFTVEKSENHKRITRAENFATGLFRMSKRPPIGHYYLEDKFQRLEAAGAVLPSLNIAVPDFRGFYHPSGLTRQRILERLAAIVWKVRAERGVNPPQLSSLLASLQDNPDEMAVFYDQNSETDEDFVSDESTFEYEIRQRSGEAERQRFRARCGGRYPCVECLRGAPDLAAKLGLTASQGQEGGLYFSDAQGNSSQVFRGNGCNEYCALKGSRLARLAFPESG